MIQLGCLRSRYRQTNYSVLSIKHVSVLPIHPFRPCAHFAALLGVGDVTEVPVHWGVHEDVYCAGKETTFEFLEGVLKEVISLFPSQYIHIGGDEVPICYFKTNP